MAKPSTSQLGLRADRGEAAGGEIEAAEALDVAILVRGHPHGAVGGIFAAAISDGLRMIADRGHAAAGEVELVEFDVGDRAIFGGDGGAVARRDRGDAPAAALDLGDAALRAGVARVDDVEVVVGAVALGRAEADELAVVAPGAERIAALAARGELGQAAVGERVELEEFVAAIVLADEQDVAGRGQAAAERFGLEADLAAVHHRPGDAVQLVDVAEAGRDQHRAVGGVPPGEAGAARFHVGARGGGERVGDGGHAVGGQRGGLGDIGERGRGGGGQAQRERGQRAVRSIMKFPLG